MDTLLRLNYKSFETNKLIFGDNVEGLKHLINEGLAGRIDLVYIDPPFATNNVFRIGTHRTSTISSSIKDAIAYNDLIVGQEFIDFLRERLILIKELLSEQGSIYLHIDYKIGHYVKILMDEVFGINNFINDITRIKCNPKNFNRKGYGNVKDMILFYSKTKSYIWNNPTESMAKEDIARLYNKIDKYGRRYTTIPIHAPGETKDGPTGREWRGMLPPRGRHWRSAPEVLDELDKLGLIEWSSNGNPRKINYAEEKTTKKRQDIWTFKDKISPLYPTEKNMDLLRTIISASSNKESIVMDCFCGSGTTMVVSSELSRRWIGIDNSENAINVVRKRFSDIRLNESEKEHNYEFIKL